MCICICMQTPSTSFKNSKAINLLRFQRTTTLKALLSMMMMWVDSIFGTPNPDGHEKYVEQIFKFRNDPDAGKKKRYQVMVKDFIENCFLQPGKLPGSHSGTSTDSATRFAIAVAKSSAWQPWLLKAAYDEDNLPPYVTTPATGDVEVPNPWISPVLHAWNEKGFIPAATLVFATRTLRGLIKLPIPLSTSRQPGAQREQAAAAAKTNLSQAGAASGGPNDDSEAADEVIKYIYICVYIYTVLFTC